MSTEPSDRATPDPAEQGADGAAAPTDVEDAVPVEPDPAGEAVADPVDDDGESEEPSWWHRDHPTFSSLAGFFTGLLTITVVPGIYGAILSSLFDFDTAEDLFPYVLVLFAVPLALLVPDRTRRFARYMLFGMVATAVVVVGVAALVLWLLISADG